MSGLRSPAEGVGAPVIVELVDLGKMDKSAAFVTATVGRH
jgi:hypothetical protein